MTLTERIQKHLEAGGEVMVATAYKATQYAPKHASMFKQGKSGSAYVQRGRNWDCIDYCTVKFF